jgi:uncharacterized protein (DUF1697 family)
MPPPAGRPSRAVRPSSYAQVDLISSPAQTRETTTQGTAVATYIALLRAVNVGGRKPVAMAALRSLATDIELTNPRTLLQSGNLVFGSEARAGEIETLLETEAQKRLGLDTTFFVRSAREWQAVIARNPFPKDAARDPSHLVVMFLKHAPASSAVAALRTAIKGSEVVRAHARHAYLVYPDGIGTSRLTTAVIERNLGTGTGRNWNTVRKLAALASG